MTNKLYLADLSDMSEEEIKEHIAAEYSGSTVGFDVRYPIPECRSALAAILENFSVIIAYESVGDCGCDSSSWFLVQEKTSGLLYEFSGSHCSCYGFEGQFYLEETTLEYLQSAKFYMNCGGYDDYAEENITRITNFLKEMK